MSGGSYDYAFGRLEDLGLAIAARHPHSPPHRAFAALLLRAAKAAHDIEWVDSGDCGEGSDLPAIHAVVNLSQELEAAVTMAQEAQKALKVTLERVEGLKLSSV